MKCHEMADHGTRRLAREIRAARAYADMSREQVGLATDLSAEMIGRYERGEWKRPLKRPLLEAIARATKIPRAYLDAGFLAPDDPVTRFADAVRREASPPDAHPGSQQADPPGEDATDADQ